MTNQSGHNSPVVIMEANKQKGSREIKIKEKNYAIIMIIIIFLQQYFYLYMPAYGLGRSTKEEHLLS